MTISVQDITLSVKDAASHELLDLIYRINWPLNELLWSSIDVLRNAVCTNNLVWYKETKFSPARTNIHYQGTILSENCMLTCL